MLRPIGSPLTIGMSGLVVASLVQSGLDLGWIGVSQTHQVALILISVPFVLQLIASLLAYLARDGSAGAALGLLSVSWLAQGVVHLTSAPAASSSALGLMLVAAGLLLFLSSATTMSDKPLIAAVFGLAGARFVLSAMYDLSDGRGWQQASGIVGLVVVVIAGYCVAAFELEDQRHRSVLPTFRRGRARLAAADFAAQGARAIGDEPGVRQTT